jgi:hypothetical protein
MTLKSCRLLVLLTFCLLALPTLQAQTKELTAAVAKDQIGDRWRWPVAEKIAGESVSRIVF